jgi:NAD(P)H-dependent FMN reductase
MRYSEKKVEASRNFGNKIWNAARYILMNLDGSEGPAHLPAVEDLAIEDKWILSKFNTLCKEVSENIDSYDGFVFGTPVYYGGPSGQILALMNRLFYSKSRAMAGKPVAAVVSCRRGGASAAFQQMNMHFMMTNMIVVTSQYWNQVHGNTPEEVLQDAEGLQTMRTLAENMTYILRCQEAGRAAGVPLPQYEPKIATNFIR